ncbi:MAG: type I DNA topoisomerase [Clostridiales bacterium]|jgi:DNA topoisomerase-1|nr:type I DNA topoisomerase [Clostridiales bacterium]
MIVESPHKAKTIKKFLGNNFKVISSVGHIRDLPKSRFGIEINKENDVIINYINIRGKKDVLDNLKNEAKKASFILLATDPDREGEAIAWHLCEFLKLDANKYKRVTFNEVTDDAVKKSIQKAGNINFNLVNAQKTRRALDRIVGYKLSPVLWHKIHSRLSAGRVQSVALKIICDRETERINFNPKEFWSIELILSNKNREKIIAKYNGDLPNIEDTKKILNFINLNKDKIFVEKIKKNNKKKHPDPPLITSTLQQCASKDLNFVSSKTMKIAQELYEEGYISYIRTDSTRISDDAYEQLKEFILNNFGNKYLTIKKIIYKTKKNSQDAHEAIRPTQVINTPDILKIKLTKDQYKIYSLIWKRFVASQMNDAIYNTQSIIISCDKYNFNLSGSILKFDGFLVVLNNKDINKKDILLPKLFVGENLFLNKIDYEQHFTQPPARFNEASLVKFLEENDIGRPSTYATIVTNIYIRGYVSKENKYFYPTELGNLVNKIISENFNDIVDINFTAKMEESLDKISNGEMVWQKTIVDFYYPFCKSIDIAEKKLEKIKYIDEKSDFVCEKCGKNMIIKYGKHGKFLCCPGFPECRNIKSFLEYADYLCPKCKSKVIIKKSRKRKEFCVCENNECDYISWKKAEEKNK